MNNEVIATEVHSIDNRDRRLRILCVDQHEVMELYFHNAAHPQQMLQIRSVACKDARLVSVRFDDYRLAFVFLLQHDSFAPVPCGERIPDLDDHTWEVVHLGDRVKQAYELGYQRGYEDGVSAP